MGLRCRLASPSTDLQGGACDTANVALQGVEESTDRFRWGSTGQGASACTA